MLKLPKTTEYVRTRRYHLVVTAELTEKHMCNLAVENELHNYALKFLERTYGYKHLGRTFPTTRTGKNYIIKDEILPRFLKEYYNLKRWNAKKIGLHSQAAYQFLVTMLTNFGEYRKVLKKASMMTEQEKEDYRNNKHGNNPKHRSWYRKGSLTFLRNEASHKTVSLPDNGQIEVLSPHWIKLQDYGVVQVLEDIRNLKNQKVVTSKIKRKGDDTFELQLVLKSTVERVKPARKAGADWNMKDEKIFHTSNDERIYLPLRASALADKYESIINGLKSRRDILSAHLNKRCRRLADLNQQIRYYNVRRTNLLTEAYRKIAKQIFDDYDLLAIEQLDAKEMRRESKALSKAGNHGKNRHLAKVKPYELAQLLTQVANREGKTLLKVDSYKTSQVEYGTDYVQKHEVVERHWRSELTGKEIIRDLNASWNILSWALDPKKHYKYRERQQEIEDAKKKGVAKTRLPKAIKPEYLVEIN